MRKPYWGEITRHIPYEIFQTCKSVLKDLGVSEPDCYMSSNKRGDVISFTSINVLYTFLSCISTLPIEEIKDYFKRKIQSGQRKNHSVRLLVSDDKDFGVVYKKRSGQLVVQFHYGEWNANKFPQHNVKNKLIKYTNIDD